MTHDKIYLKLVQFEVICDSYFLSFAGLGGFQIVIFLRI